MDNITDIRTRLESLLGTIFIVNELSNKVSDGSPEICLMCSILLRAMEDIKYLFDDGATKEQKSYGRSALSWIFFERPNNISKLYSNYANLPELKKRQFKLTTFNNICGWLDIEPSYLRKNIIEKYSMNFLDFTIV